MKNEKNTQTKTFKAASKKMAADHGPNEKYPFALKFTDAKGAVSYERFKTAKERDARKATQPGAKSQDFVSAVVPESAQVTEGAPGAGGGKSGKPAAKKAAATETPKAAKPAKAAKKAEPKPKDESLKIRLYAVGQFYFGKMAAARLNSAPYVQIEIKGKTVTLTPTKSEKDAVKVGACHASPTVSAGRLLAETGWTKTTQDLVAKPVGAAGFQLEVK
jgi:hypothetical protein